MPSTLFRRPSNLTAYDNHELGNKQYINGGAPQGGAVGDFPNGAGVDATQSANDVNTTGSFMNKTGGFKTLQDVYLNYQPVREDRAGGTGLITGSGDARTDGTPQLYFSQPWGKNLVFINADDRTYRDIRMKVGSADDTGPRADNSGRTMLGAPQLQWLENTLLAAEQASVPWKVINISDPIDQLGPIGTSLTLVNPPAQADYGTLGALTAVVTTADVLSGQTSVTVASTVGLAPGQGVSGSGIQNGTTIKSMSTDGHTFTLSKPTNALIPNGSTLSLTPAASTYAPVASDGGKSWMGGYRFERNALLKFIADHHIRNVIFLATDDHQNRVNELTYSPTGETGKQASYVKVPYCFSIVCGPLGATGPDQISNHTLGLAENLINSVTAAQTSAGIEPIGLAGYPGLHNVNRADAAANPYPDPDTVPPVYFYSPDTFNYNALEISEDGQTLTVTSYGINSTLGNGFVEYDKDHNAERQLFSFQITAAAAPSFDSCGDISVPTDTNQCSATLDLPTASGFPAPTVVCTLDSDSTHTPLSSPYTFPKGAAAVTCVASSETLYGTETATCSFTVTVSDKQKPSVSASPGIVSDNATVVLHATDNCDPTSGLQIYVKDSAEGPCGGTFSAGPYAPGTRVKLARNKARASILNGGDGAAALIKTIGNPVLVVTDSSGNQQCTLVPVGK